MGNCSSKIPPPSQMSEDVANSFPLSFKLSYRKAFTLKVVMDLTTPGSSTPSYLFTMPQHLYGNLILHGGPTPEHPALATAVPEGKWKQDFGINLPAIPGVPSSQPSEELLRYRCGLRKEQYWFGMVVGEGDKRHVERFEWRHSRSAEVRSVGQSSFGWKLVRLGRGFGGAEGAQSAEMVTKQKQEIYEKEVASDEDDEAEGDLVPAGEEIVAVWADAKLFSSGLKGIGEFQFMGSGATDELGTQWKLMAVMSCVCAYVKLMQQQSSTAAA